VSAATATAWDCVIDPPPLIMMRSFCPLEGANAVCVRPRQGREGRTETDGIPSKVILSMFRPSRINPTISVNKAVHGPYNWSHFPLTPPECKAVIYEVPESRGSWASHGTDAWYVGPSLDHYQYSHFFVPDTRAYRVSDKSLYFFGKSISGGC
jgi:hypothetical protein